jgi:hypothetical protein
VEEVELTILDQQGEVALAELVELEFQELDQVMQADLIMEPQTEVVAVEETVNLHLQVLLKLDLVDLV